jgi:hypothetical protein
MFNRRKGERSPTSVKAGDDGRMPPPGHYAGQTSQEGTISFDVAPHGWHIANLMLTVTARQPRGGRGVIDLPLAVGWVIPVGPGGRWRARISGEGVTVVIEAFLNGSGIKGDLRVDIASDGGELSTGSLTWYARQAVLPPY